MIEKRSIWEVNEDAPPPYVTAFVKKVEERIREMATEDPVIQKIANDEAITETDLTRLEETLTDAGGVNINEEVLQKGYRQPRGGTLVDFIKSVLGLYRAPDPKKKIDEAFQTFMAENNKHYTADQLHFIRTIQTVFMRKKHIDMTDLWDAPFTNFGINAPLPMFDEGDLRAFIGICQGLEQELYVAEA
ncbi:type I restriction-modification enzyme R subunit C-terminal domain-containing protein [Methanogenium cariaci]|uniref:type I restriction-modification enzyme R subunit C-terminal domain-containing protein n=1 Tax=Methanogenium cariaci TaxID=2197 RepID=UPI001FDF5858|nr:type I restriction-modification enzyme R subunit C-terminal domain-containing protein [Methanogenium cariaci]